MVNKVVHDIFDVRTRSVDDYSSFTSAFVDIRDEHVKRHVEEELGRGRQWPDLWISFNPSFASGGAVDGLVRDGLLHGECERIFRVKQRRDDTGEKPLVLHQHQRDAVEVARAGHNYVLTTGTGSGRASRTSCRSWTTCFARSESKMLHHFDFRLGTYFGQASGGRKGDRFLGAKLALKPF